MCVFLLMLKYSQSLDLVVLDSGLHPHEVKSRSPDLSLNGDRTRQLSLQSFMIGLVSKMQAYAYHVSSSSIELRG
jgi:hypothetical protein